MKLWPVLSNSKSTGEREVSGFRWMTAVALICCLSLTVGCDNDKKRTKKISGPTADASKNLDADAEGSGSEGTKKGLSGSGAGAEQTAGGQGEVVHSGGITVTMKPEFPEDQVERSTHEQPPCKDTREGCAEEVAGNPDAPLRQRIRIQTSSDLDPNQYEGDVPEIVQNPEWVHPDRIFVEPTPDEGGTRFDDASYTGAMDPSGLLYSGGGQDNLLKYLYDRLELEQQAAVQEANLRFAAEIHRVELVRQVQQNRYHLNFTRWLGANDRHVRKYTYEGSRRGDVVEFHPVGDCPQDLNVRMVCVDDEPNCRVAVVEMMHKDLDQQGRVYVVHRATRGNLHSTTSLGEYSRSGPYESWTRFIYNTEKYLRGEAPIRYPYISDYWYYTSAVVYGEASYYTRMVVQEGNGLAQEIEMSGALVKEEGTKTLRRPITIATGKTTRDGKEIRASSDYMDMVTDIFLVNNDGRGNLRFEVYFEGGEGLMFSAMRMHPDIDMDRLNLLTQ